jgi:hypothetical protein
MAVQLCGPVAFVDLLGFKDFVRDSDPTKLQRRVEKFSEAVELAMTWFTGPSPIKGTLTLRLRYAVFSDSLIIYENRSPDLRESQKRVERLIKCCSHLSYLLLELDQPFRGCIAEGEYIVEHGKTHSGTIVAGKPLLDAYDWEQRLQWIGIVLHPSVQDQSSLGVRPTDSINLYFRAQTGLEYSLMMDKYPAIPLRKKKEAVELEYADAPAILSVRKRGNASASQREFLNRYIESLRWASDKLEFLKRKAPPKDSSKYNATLAWYRDVLSSRESLIGEIPSI